jgi:hypothetical protein
MIRAGVQRSEEVTMIARERFVPTPGKIVWGRLLRQQYPRACSACRSVHHVVAADNLGKTGFCAVCLEGAKSNRELGGES